MSEKKIPKPQLRYCTCPGCGRRVEIIAIWGIKSKLVECKFCNVKFDYRRNEVPKNQA